MKKIIGFVGNQGSGKSEAIKFITQMVEKIEVIKVSDILKKTLNIWGLPINASNMQKISDIMKNNFSEKILENSVSRKINESKCEIIIIDGIRGQNILKLIKENSNSFVIFIKSNKDTRFERILKRNEKNKESEITKDQFDELENHRTEKNVPLFEKTAEYIVNNNGTLEDLRSNIEKILLHIESGV